MLIRRVRIFGFRSVESADIVISPSAVLLGPNGCGKSTIIDAISLAIGRSKMVRPLTEHDFNGSCPDAASRIRILVTLAGFKSNDPSDHYEWFQKGRGIPKWIDSAGNEYPTETVGAELCVTVGFTARFDLDSLEVEHRRYFHDDDAIDDPFLDEGSIYQVSQRLLNEVGYFVLPARRTWDAVASFNSELFRRTISNSAGIPVKAILDQRDHLRSPLHPVEDSPELKVLTTALNEQLGRIMLKAPKFQLRVTAGDSDAVLQALLPHYETTSGPSLPAYRHGTGLLSIQSLLLLLEIGRGRRDNNQSFVVALEEPELHLAPGVESRLVAEALRISDQVICTTHSPEVARLFDPTTTMVLSNEGGTVFSRPLLQSPLSNTSKGWEQRFYGQLRSRLVSALMHPFVLVPEGRLDVDWLGRIASIGDRQIAQHPPFSCVYGLAPTEDAQVAPTVMRLSELRGRIIALVDGDPAGDEYVKVLSALPHPPHAIIQWPNGWTIEHVVIWIIEAGGNHLLKNLQNELPHVEFESFEELGRLLATEGHRGKGVSGLKQDHVSHEAIVATFENDENVGVRAAEVCDALVSVALGKASESTRLVQVSAEGVLPPHYRFAP